MKKITYTYVMFTLLLCSIGIIPSVANAQEIINIHPVLPDNQKSGTKGYFHLQMEKEQKQTVYMTIINQSNETKILQIFPSNSLTNQNGGIHYTVGEGSEFSYSLDKQFFMKQYMEVQESITLAPHSQKKLPIKIQAPKKEGTYLGSVLFSEKGKGKTEKREQNFSIAQESLFGIAVQVTVGQEQKGEVFYKKTELAMLPSGVYVYMTFENEFPQLLESVTGNYEVSRDGKIMFKGTIDSFKMAPMSGVKYTIPWHAKEIQKGHYVLDMTLVSNGKAKHIRENITATEKEVSVYENKTKPDSNMPVVKEKEKKMKWWWIGGGVVLFLFGWLLGRRKKKEKNSGE